MATHRSGRVWHVDREMGTVSCQGIVIRFGEDPDKSIRLAFVTGDDRGLEEQCLLAGEALAAIEIAFRQSLCKQR